MCLTTRAAPGCSIAANYMTETSLQDLYQRLAQARAGDRPRLKKRLDGLSRRFSEHGRDKVAAAIDISVAARERRRGLLAAPLQFIDLCLQYLLLEKPH